MCVFINYWPTFTINIILIDYFYCQKCNYYLSNVGLPDATTLMARKNSACDSYTYLTLTAQG